MKKNKLLKNAELASKLVLKEDKKLFEELGKTQTPRNKEHYDFLNGLYHYINIAVWCEECSTPDHPVQMGEGTCPSFKCPICKKEVMILTNPVFNFGSHYSANCDKCIELEKKGIVFGRSK